jgi:hypothetical protein
MAKRGGLGGGKAGSDSLIATVAGGVAAVILDFTANSMRIPGFNQPVYKITPARGGKTATFTAVDYGQMGLSVALGSFGFGQGGSSRLPAFAWGMLLTQIISKIGLPSLGLPRYLAFDLDSEGRLVPVKTFG